MPQTHGISVKPVIRGLQRVVLELQFFDAWLDKTVPYFWHRVRVQSYTPRHHRSTTVEYEYPYRISSSHVVRVAGRLGLAFGRWQEEHLDEDEAPALAAQAHPAEWTVTFHKWDGEGDEPPTECIDVVK